MRFVEGVVREAGAIAKHFSGRMGAIRDKGAGDLLTATDLEIDGLIRSRLRRRFPSFGILSEESETLLADSDYTWILDPIDGTQYFMAGIPLYAISLALKCRDETVLGMVYNPESDQLFAACSDGPPTLDGNPIGCSRVALLEEAILCVEIPNKHYSKDVNHEAMDYLRLLTDKVAQTRIIGVSALGMCYCASGGFDAYLNVSTGSKEWDLAAGEFIFRRAGAVITRNASGHIVGGPSALHASLLELFAEQGGQSWGMPRRLLKKP